MRPLMNVIWEVGGAFNSLILRARMVDTDGDVGIEVLLPNNQGFFSRLKQAFLYLFLRQTVLLTYFPLTDPEQARLVRGSE